MVLTPTSGPKTLLKTGKGPPCRMKTEPQQKQQNHPAATSTWVFGTWQVLPHGPNDQSAFRNVSDIRYRHQRADLRYERNNQVSSNQTRTRHSMKSCYFWDPYNVFFLFFFKFLYTWVVFYPLYNPTNRCFEHCSSHESLLLMIWLGGLGPGGLDSWDPLMKGIVRGTPRIPNHHPQTTSLPLPYHLSNGNIKTNQWIFHEIITRF